MKIFEYVINRLSEASTIRGFILFLGACGLSIEPQLSDQIIAATIAGSGVIGMLVGDSKSE